MKPWSVRWVTFGEPRKTTLGQVLVCAIIVVVLGAVLFPVTASDGGPGTRATACLSNLKQIGLTTALYSNDCDDRLPPSHVWYDVEEPYRKAWLQCTEIPRTLKGRATVGYAMNQWLSLVPQGCLSRPADTFEEYDSTNLLPNASDPVNSLVEGGRHAGRNNVVYTDGHAKRLAWPETPGIRNPRIDAQCMRTGKPPKKG